MPIKHLLKASQSGAGAPTSVIPDFIGQVYFNTADDTTYIAKTIEPISWILLGNNADLLAHLNAGSGEAHTAEQIAFTHPELVIFNVETVKDALDTIVDYLLGSFFAITDVKKIDGTETILEDLYFNLPFYDVARSTNFKVKLRTSTFDGSSNVKVPEGFDLFLNGLQVKPGILSDGNYFEFVDNGNGYAEIVRVHKDLVNDVDNADSSTYHEIHGKGKGFTL